MILLFALACQKEPAEDTGPTAGQLDVLTYNVHGLPSGITGDDTPGRMAQIAPLLDRYPLIGLQEDWDEANAATLAAALERRTELWFGEPLDERFYGAGLAFFAEQAVESYEPTYYETCNGTLDGASDCLASKGFQVVRLRMGPGATLDVYNTHMEAGNSAEDDSSRTAQLDMLLAQIDSFSAGHAVLFMGDTNLGADDPEDVPLIAALMEGGGFTDACDAVACPEPGRIDKLLVRDGEDLAIDVDSWAVAEEFVDEDGAPLSDHEGITASLRWAAR